MRCCAYEEFTRGCVTLRCAPLKREAALVVCTCRRERLSDASFVRTRLHCGEWFLNKARLSAGFPTFVYESYHDQLFQKYLLRHCPLLASAFAAVFAPTKESRML